MSEMLAKSPEQLEREEIVRQALEGAARKLEEQGFESDAYQKAFKTAAKVVRAMKP